jgi:hypothetical protein
MFKKQFSAVLLTFHLFFGGHTVFGQKTISFNNKMFLMGSINDTLFKADKISSIGSNLYLVVLNSKKGIINQKGKIIVPQIFDYINSSYYGIVVQLGDKKGLYDLKGNELCQPQYDRIENINWGSRFPVWLIDSNGSKLLMNSHKKIITSKPYKLISKIRNIDSLYVVMTYENKTYMYGLIDWHGNEILEQKYPYIEPNNSTVNYNYLMVKYNSNVSFINIKTKTFINDEKYNDAKPFETSSFTWVKNTDNLWGAIDTSGKTIIPFVYKKNGSPFFDGYAVVEQDKKYGLLDSLGNLILRFEFDHIQDHFCNGYRYYCSKDETGYFDQSFRFIKNPKKPVSLDSILGNIGVLKGISGLRFPYKNGENKVLDSFNSFSVESLVQNGLKSMINIPLKCTSACEIQEHILYYGLGASGLMGVNYSNYTQLNSIKQDFLFKVIRSETMRNQTWNWIRPQLKICFQYMNPIAKETYKNLFRQLKVYLKNYNLKLVQKEYDLLAKNQTSNNNKKPRIQNIDSRLAGTIDRLIVYHKVISLEDCRRWVYKIADEIDKW